MRKITNQMIHPDVRLIGSVLRLFTSGMTEERFVKAHQNELKKVGKGKAKNAAMRTFSLERPDGTKMRVMELKPKHKVEQVPAVLWLHGGGYVLGYPENEIAFMEKFLDTADCVMISPDYRLGLDVPYPAALDDAYMTLLWLKEHAGELGARDDQIFVIGGSAGGGLTAALTIYARDKGEVNIAFQMPMFPMLDDRGITESSKDNDAPMWDSNSNTIAWKLYLGSLYGSDAVPPYAAPARLEDFSNLPPAYSYVGTIEPFYDETRIYFEKLKAAGVESTLDIYPGGFHGFDELGASTPLGKDARRKLLAAFEMAVKTRFASQS